MGIPNPQKSNPHNEWKMKIMNQLLKKDSLVMAPLHGEFGYCHPGDHKESPSYFRQVLHQQACTKLQLQNYNLFIMYNPSVVFRLCTF